MSAMWTNQQTHHFDVTSSVNWKIPFLLAQKNFGRWNRNFQLNTETYSIERNEKRLERNETRLARNETRGGNLHLSGTVYCAQNSTRNLNVLLEIGRHEVMNWKFQEVWDFLGMSPKYFGWYSRFSGRILFTHGTAQTAFVRAVTPAPKGQVFQTLVRD